MPVDCQHCRYLYNEWEKANRATHRNDSLAPVGVMMTKVDVAFEAMQKFKKHVMVHTIVEKPPKDLQRDR